MKTDYAGIDYSLGMSNRNQETGIHYGVIHANEVGQAWWDESGAFYPNTCPHCGDDLDSQRQELVYPVKCLTCNEKLEEQDFDFQEPTSYYYTQDGYQAEQSADDTDIFIMESPYFTYAQFCSPCAPGAGYLLNYTDPNVGVKTYCFGHDWFESGKAPYPVYEVETGKKV